MVNEPFLHGEAAHELLTESGSMRRGPKQHAREEVDAIQRARLIAATVATVADVGYAGLTVAQVIDRAKVSRRTFYELYKDTADCFLATYRSGLEQALGLVTDAYMEESSWREGVRSGLATLLGFLDLERGWARLLIVEGLSAGDDVLALRVDTIRTVAAALGATSDESLPLAAEVVVGGSMWVIYSHLVDHPEESLMDLHGALMAMIMLPFLGEQEARREMNASLD
jgi:AcrR family transcriptional regulator